MECLACRQNMPSGARFCPSCGAAAVAATAEVAEERRIITAIFCDLVGSTTLAGLLDAEALRSVTLRYFSLMRERIQAHGGLVEKFIGDAVMAVFGIPEIHEDDALHALAASLDMLAALDDLNADIERAFRIRLQVRIGVNTGEAVTVAAAGAAIEQALVSGEVVNVAARLEQHAPPGQILIGLDTLRAAGNAAVTEDVGFLSVHGKAEPVPAHRLLGLRGDAPELTRRFDTPFIGREAEFAQLNLILARVGGTAQAHLVTIFGDAGIGKTRLVREWLARLPGSTATIMGTGRCRPFADSGTLTPLADAFRQLMGDRTRPDALAGAFAVLDSGLLQDGTPNPSADDTCAATVQVLSALARERTVVLVVDDCQWGSGTLLDLVDQIQQDLAAEPLLVLCLARPDLLDSRPAWGGGRLNSSSLVLSGLSAPESALLAAKVGDVMAHDARAQANVLERAGGNPLHIEQLIDALERTGRPQDIPLTLQALLGARVGALHPRQRTLLQLAAVVGREFAIEEVLDLMAQEPAARDLSGDGDHRREFRDLVRLRLIEPARERDSSRTRYRFCSALIHEAIYHGMVKRVRAERHQRVAALGKRCNAAPAMIGSHLESAYHYRADLGIVGAPTETLRRAAGAMLRKAGTAAMARSDLSWAEDLLERALALAIHTDPEWAEMARQTGEIRLARGHLAPARELLQEVLAAATQAADTRTAMHVRLDLAIAEPKADPAMLAALARESLTVFSAARDSLGIARAAIRVAQEHQFQGQHAKATRLLTRALDHAARADAEPERAMALGAIGVSLWHGPVPADAAIHRCQELLEEHSGRRAVRMSLSCPLAVLHALRGDFDTAAQRLAVADDIGRASGHAEAALVLPFFAATIQTLADHEEQAESLLRQALASAHTCGDVGLLGAIQLDLARVLMTRGADTEAADLLSRQDGGLAPSAAADAYGVGARLAARRGREDEALHLADEALAEARRTDSPVLLATAHLDRAHTFAAVARYQEAGNAAARAAALFGRKGHEAGVRSASALLGKLGAS